MQVRRTNAEKLIRAGCVTTPSTDTYLRGAPEFLRTPRDDYHAMPGTGTLAAIDVLFLRQNYDSIAAEDGERLSVDDREASPCPV